MVILAALSNDDSCDKIGTGVYMKKQILAMVAFFVLGVFLPCIVEGQGEITYISNLGDTSTGSQAVGNDSWLAGGFITGLNPGGYVLNSVDLAMTEASGSPDDFSVMLYSSINNATTTPGDNLGVLSGSLSPVTAGAYTYTAPLDLTLSPNTIYFVTVTAGTAIANGAYNWGVTTTTFDSYNNYHWAGPIVLYDSSDGLNWNVNSGVYEQFSLNASAVPEPGVLGLFGLGGLCFFWYRRKAKASAV
jgi:hypothetical protein